MSRSFTGCKRCKARRQKCDELRPNCGRCQTAGEQCQYAMQLQWGGRAFSRSRFGACVGTGGMQRLEYSPGEFIYTTKTAVQSASAKTGSDLTLSQPVDPFSSLSSSQKALLHHFINDASQITACHSGMQQDITRMLIPMALQTPSLLYATTALSAIHIQALHNQSETVKSAPDIARLMALSLEHFRTELQNPSSKDPEALVATARTLCLAEIHSGAINPNSWRAHVDGARALMRASDAAGEDSLRSTSGFRRYLDRWYWSIVSLTALTGNGPPIGDISDFVSSDLMGLGGSTDYLDDYWGFSVDLAAVFRQIGAAAWRSHQVEKATQGFVAGEVDDSVENDAASLEFAIRQLMNRDSSSQPSFYPRAAEGLSAETAQQLLLCNEAFQHSALIQIHRRLRKTPTTSPEVQQSVRRILECTAQIGPSSGLSPWVMLTTPIFIAGCEARGQDRDTVRQLLSSLHDTIRVPNVLQSLRFLEQYWSNQLSEEEDWSHFLERMQFDFIPY
ncbi:transcriptional regulator family: Fungal Specific TF [Penicillium roqueforti]|uniref:Zn(2)-C6 fungal-type DNA-binding domain n=1 Tax=Penicillium roqueforti (strain FM164) TaxID=1365484 RepID=W6QLI4_PENRF|nr:transcriptional regulator family: Fungal Specific TF [Penicillium roqueforti]CDM30422.1 Zn(2)-C6 fungal-type DNA-binding domain [Penicillium roqueforti FM164]KAF9240796.1 transcriptional regulator family: Fungal Specific TF [Penicillium roqueforti]KAI1838543.1 transcriptional regulator family: Fungal Specific TF [Penicillium roqueforti]KAI2680850.1 transcriptional regulator family: Fungal Specific TF [Penicillium roqueforti]KAI2691677.1 transcriptional regulator family: Fungal Specific TF [